MHKRTSAWNPWNLPERLPAWSEVFDRPLLAIMTVIMLMSITLSDSQSAGGRESLRRFYGNRRPGRRNRIPWRKAWGSTSFRDRPQRS